MSSPSAPNLDPPREGPSRKVVTRRDTRTSKRLELGRYLCGIDWSLVDLAVTCEEKLSILSEVVEIGLSHIMPEMQSRVHVNDPPWITSEFKELIAQRQRAFRSGDLVSFRSYRNAVNRERKRLRSNYFTTKVKHLKESKPSQWWASVKRIAGMTPSSGSENVLSLLQHVDGCNNLIASETANVVNCAFLEPMKSFVPIEPATPSWDESTFEVSEPEVLFALKQLKSNKAGGPDKIPNWFLKEYAEILAQPFTSILNASFVERRLPPSWKSADVVPLPKQRPVETINKHLRPISLTPAMSKVAEDFVVRSHVGPAVLKQIDPDQYGGIPNSSTLHALISMVHRWTEATDGSGAAVRVVLFDYRKAFDLIDHQTLVRKIFTLDIPRCVANWVVDFLSHRKQRVKLSLDCFSEWGSVPAGVPQGTKLGPWLFLLMINDLRVADTLTWKYVDDTTIAEIVPRNEQGNAQVAVDAVECWSKCQLMQLNADKCKELRIDFKRNKHLFQPLTVDSKELPVVNSAKILGVTLANNLKWNDHVSESIKKANKRLYFLVMLKRAGVPLKDIVAFYTTAIRPVLEYCSPVFHHALPKYLCNDIERVQKRALSIIMPNNSYEASLVNFNLTTLQARREQQCFKLFDSISGDHKLSGLVPLPKNCNYNLRNKIKYLMPRFHTDRFRQSFIPAMCSRFLSS